MTDDAFLFNKERRFDMLPLYEGKMIHHFTHIFANPKYWIDESQGRKAVLGRAKDTGESLGYQMYRLAYRDVASSTNERTLISTILPPQVFTGNTLVLSTSPNSLADLLSAVSLLNSFVVDWMIRQKVTSHCNMFYVYQLPIPRLTADNKFFYELVERAAKLICTTPEFNDLAREVGLGGYKAGVTNEEHRAKLRAELDGMIAHIYGLTEEEFAYILTAFPLVAEEVKVAALDAYRDIL
jgi:hypothetical protein